MKQKGEVFPCPKSSSPLIEDLGDIVLSAKEGSSGSPGAGVDALQPGKTKKKETRKQREPALCLRNMSVCAHSN